VISLGRDFHDFLCLLNQHRVRYLIIGGFAVAAHGRPRYTKDIDIWLDTSQDNPQRVERVLSDFGFASLGLGADDFSQPDCIVQLGREPNRIDLLTEAKALNFEDCYNQRLVLEISAVKLPFLSKQHLILNKRAVGRPRDLVDADELEEC
jgi:hypothetical protein